MRRGAEEVLDALAKGQRVPWKALRARLEAEQQALTRGFDRLLCEDSISVELYDHQRQAVLRVLRDMRGRALLADEVGLGKTIEAGVIVKEYLVRGLARKVLILAPASLLTQWRQELEDKLGIPARINRSAENWQRWDCIIASLDTARKSPHADIIREISWDIVVVDEAHRLKNRATASWRLVDGVTKKYLLLLTATPIQNDLTELYNLFTLLKPGLLRSYAAFRREFMIDRRSAKQVQPLRQRLAEVMVRTTRREALLRLPRRIVETVPVRLSAAEDEFYRSVLAYARGLYRGSGGQQGLVLPLILLLRELCSSPDAAQRTLAAMAAGNRLPPDERRRAAELARVAGTLGECAGKLAAATTWIARQREPVIVFTEFRATQEALARRLAAAGVNVVLFHGGLSRDARTAAVQAFRDTGGVLISTEAGGEGQNLQFCRTVVNYDLPWNPMRVEQRIGRVHRLGQTRDVHIVNFIAPATIEDHVYRLLHEKLQMFRQVIGDLDLILAQEPNGFERAVGRAVLASADDAETAERLSVVGRQLDEARSWWQGVRRLNEEVLDDGHVR